MSGSLAHPLIVATVVAVLTLGAGGALTRIGPWYRGLRKPAWQPPDWLFAPAWSIIAVLTVLAAALAWTHRGAAGWLVLVLFAANVAANVAWSGLFFALRRPDWALAEVALLWASCLSLVLGLAALAPVAGLLVLPYFLWVSFAAYLNLAIVRLNRPFAPA